MARVNLDIRFRGDETGFSLFTACIGSLAEALRDTGGAGSDLLEIEDDGAGNFIFRGAPLNTCVTRTERDADGLLVVLVFRPAAGLGMLVAAAEAHCGRPLSIEWLDGWPMVSVGDISKDILADEPDSQRESAALNPPASSLPSTGHVSLS